MMIFYALFPARLKPDGIQTLIPSEVVNLAPKLVDRHSDPALDHRSLGFRRRAPGPGPGGPDCPANAQMR